MKDMTKRSKKGWVKSPDKKIELEKELPKIVLSDRFERAIWIAFNT